MAHKVPRGLAVGGLQLLGRVLEAQVARRRRRVNCAVEGRVEPKVYAVRPFQEIVALRVAARAARILLLESDPEAAQIEQKS